MSLPIKLTIGGLGLSAIIIPGAWMAITGEPASVILSDSSTNKNEYENKFGGVFQHHLVSAEAGKNQGWWVWAFRYRWQEDGEAEKEQEFKGVTDGASLREKCESFYKKEIKKEIKKEKSAWRYCSLEGRMPKTVKETAGESNSDGTIGKTNENDLVSTKDPSNNKFWEIQEKAFFKEANGLGSKATGDSSFKKLYEAKTGSLKKVCQEAYEKQESGADQEKKDALLFCSLLAKSD